MATDSFLFFLGVCLLVAATPGPAVLYTVTRTLDQGMPAGLASAAGVVAGGVIHVLLAAFGVAAAASAWPVSLLVLQVGGALYLIWIGWQRVRAARAIAGPSRSARQRLQAIFWEGVVVNLTNPKTVLFLLAFLPQFVDSDAGELTAQLLILGFSFVVVATCSDLIYILAAGLLRRRMSRSVLPKWSSYVAGGVYAALGLLGLIDAGRQVAVDFK